jgi:hypothetical protein
MPNDGALLLVEWDLARTNLPSRGKFMNVTMMVLTSGKERAIEEYRSFLESVGFRLNQVVSAGAELNVLEALPV